MKQELEQAAIAYWQDRLAKFFPTSEGPTGSEIEMFKAGYRLLENQLLNNDLDEDYIDD